jgi:hypothetical protein
MACRAMLSPPVKPEPSYQPPPISIRTITRHVGIKGTGKERSSRRVYSTVRAGVAIGTVLVW